MLLIEIAVKHVFERTHACVFHRSVDDRLLDLVVVAFEAVSVGIVLRIIDFRPRTGLHLVVVVVGQCAGTLVKRGIDLFVGSCAEDGCRREDEK